jgi:hypothetical protein
VRHSGRDRNLPAVRLSIILAALFFLPAHPALGQAAIRIELMDTAVLASQRLMESSGIVASARAPGVYWTHNDSGDGAFLYATDSAGRDLGAVRVAGASAVDWEDLAAGPCVVTAGRCFYVGDIGDNGARRPYVIIYRVPEPDPPHGPSDTLGFTAMLDSIVLRYPDGPHNAEALVVTRAGVLLIITKDLIGPARLFRATLRRGPTDRVLRFIGTLGLQTSALTGRLVTGAAVSPDDSLLVARTYVSLHFFQLRGDSLPKPLGPPAGITIPVVEPQGESVCFDGTTRLILTSERGLTSRAVLTRLRLTWPAHGQPTSNHRAHRVSLRALDFRPSLVPREAPPGTPRKL